MDARIKTRVLNSKHWTCMRCKPGNWFFGKVEEAVVQSSINTPERARYELDKYALRTFLCHQAFRIDQASTTHRSDRSTVQSKPTMSQLEGYLIPIAVVIIIKAGAFIFNIFLEAYLSLLNFAESFPHTAARYQHWKFLLSDDNLSYWNLQQTLQVALLPSYMIFFWEAIEIRYTGSWPPRSTFNRVHEALFYSWVASKCYSIFVIFYVGWSAPPGGSKLLIWIDLWMESFLTTTAAVFLGHIPLCLSSLAFGWANFKAAVRAYFWIRR